MSLRQQLPAAIGLPSALPDIPPQALVLQGSALIFLLNVAKLCTICTDCAYYDNLGGEGGDDHVSRVELHERPEEPFNCL